MNNVVKKFKNGRNIQLNKSSGIRKMQTASGGPITYEKDWSDRLEPYASGLGLAGDAVGIGAAATGVGIPAGTLIAGVANIPNLVIDGYLSGRDIYRSFKDNGASLGSAAWNSGELLLDAFGLKFLRAINKASKVGVTPKKILTLVEKDLVDKPWKRVGTGVGRIAALNRRKAKLAFNKKRNVALRESTNVLAKKGVRESLGEYFRKKLADEMARRGYGISVNDAIKSANRTIRQNLGIVSGVSGGTNIYHLLPTHKNGGQIRKMLTAAGGPINYKRWDDAKITSYTIPFIKEKAIKLTNAGRATGAVLSTNLLDSLADNAIRAGVPIRTAIGISTKESTLGNPTDDRSAWNISSKIRKLFNGVYPGTVQHINNGTNLVNGINLINYHKGNIDHEMFNGAQGKSIIQEGLEFYKTHPNKYNPGLKEYQKAVDNRGKEVMNSPEVLKWYREWERSKAQIFRPEPYKINTNIQNTAQEFVSRNKQGGKINMLEFLKNGSGIHIKKKNRGKFTSYCGGKVTDECIRKAKASGNPTLVKRATFAANARKWKHLNGGILKALLGTNLDVDNLVDTTRKGWGKLPYFGAANNSNTAGLWDLLNYNVTKNPNVITGAPEILPGRVEMLEKEAPTIYNMIVEHGKNIKDGYRGIWNGTSYKNLYDTLRDFFKTGDKNILTLLENWAKKNKDTFVRRSISESIPKGFTKGNEVTTVGRETASEAGLSIRDTKLGNMNNHPTNPSEKIAVEDWNKMNPDNRISSKLATGKPSYELELGGLKIDIRYPKKITPQKKSTPSILKSKTNYALSGTAHERFIEGKKNGISKKGRVSSNDRNARAMEASDARITNSGFTGVKRGQLSQVEKNLEHYPEFEKKLFNKKLLNMYRNNRPESEIKKVRNDFYRYLAERYGYFKKGGILKAEDGTKVNTFLKIGNFFTSDSGKGLLNFGSSLVTGGLLLNNLSKGKLEYFESEDKNVITKGNEAYKNANVDNEVLQYMSWINSLGDNGGDIVRNYISEKLKNNIRFNAMSEAKAEAEENKKKFMNLYNEASNEIYNNAIKSAFDFASTFANSKNGAPSNDNT